MRLVNLLNLASIGYRDGDLDSFFDSDTGEYIDNTGDTLAMFIVRELHSTFLPDTEDQAQLEEAIRAMTVGKGELESVIKALTEAATPCRNGETESRGS